MIEHIVCFKFKPETTPEQVDRLFAMLRGLKEKIPGIIDLTCGRTITPERGQGFSAALVVRLKDRASLEAYGPHPDHQPVKAYIGEICEPTLAIDYEI